ncbi:MAG: class I SAM-dependent methyltransferase [Parcubacteria group bacterium]
MSSYDKNVNFWRRTKKTIQSDYICRPQAIDLLSEVRGKRIIDIGCGDGYVSRILASRGAKITAVDVSKGLILSAINQETIDNLGIEYRIESALDLKSVEDESFECAVSIMVFGHFNNNEMHQSLRETCRILKSGGVFVLAVPHPAMYIARLKTRWVEFNNQHPDYWGNEDRLVLRTNDEQEFSVVAKKHTLEEYLNGLIGCGFLIQEVSEPKANEDDMKEYSEMWGCEDKVPFYLVIKATKK